MTEFPDYKYIRLEAADNIATLTMSRPDVLNAMNEGMHTEIVDAVEQVGLKNDIRALIITGEGKGFSTGEDIKELSERNRRLANQSSRAVQGLPRKVAVTPLALRRLEIPVIAAVNGVCAGAGFGLVYMSDLRVASRSARFLEVYVRRGFPSSSGPWFLSRIVGPTKAAEMVLLGDEVNAEEALQLGLVNKVVADEDLLAEAQSLARRIASAPTTTVRLSKYLLQRALDLPLDDYLKEGSFVRGYARTATREAIEGADAFWTRRESGASEAKKD